LDELTEGTDLPKTPDLKAVPSNLSQKSTSSFSSSSEDDFTDSKASLNGESNRNQKDSEQVIPKISWWDYVAHGEIKRSKPGFGVVKFFRRYSKVAHHLLCSILLGRVLIIYGDEKDRVKISKILTALIPLVPCTQSSWKLLRWHRGILIKSHLQQYRLIGLCIPERLKALDLLDIQDQNLVTMLDVQTQSILGPSYSGKWLKPLENLCHKNYPVEGDDSFLSFIGTIFCDIESSVFMLKSLVHKKDTKGSKNSRDALKLCKDLNISGSDAEIVRFLGESIESADMAVEIF